MASELASAIVSAGSALLGALVGGLTTYLTTRHLKHEEWRQLQFDRERSKREELYSSFIAECGRVLIASLDTTFEHAKEVTAGYNLLGRIRLIASEKVSAAAEKALEAVIETHSVEGRQAEVDKELKIFIESAREDLASIPQNA